MCAICDTNVQKEYILNISVICKYGPLLPTDGPVVAMIEETVVAALLSIEKKKFCAIG